MENRADGMDMRSLQHDMRAPIANVIALAQLSMRALSGGGTEESILPYLSRILVAAKELEQLTGEMTGSDGVHEERFTALDIAQMLGMTLGAQAAQKNQLLRVDVSGLGSETLIGDRTALMRVLINLLTNAVKYTPCGGKVTLTGRMICCGRNRVQAEFTVEDNGMGMKPEFMARMFEPFARAPEVAEGEIDGCGLGLSIVRQLTQRLGGSIDVRSEWGKGTAFTLALPLKTGKESGAALAGRNVLLAEDNDLSAEIAQAILSGQGASVSRAENGRHALDIFAGEPVGAFDVILLDMHMPEMDGCTAAKAIRESGHEDAKRIPILALTAGGGVQDTEEAIASGMDACLRKPLSIGELCAAMRLSAQQGQRNTPTPERR